MIFETHTQQSLQFSQTSMFSKGCFLYPQESKASGVDEKARS